MPTAPTVSSSSKDHVVNIGSGRSPSIFSLLSGAPVLPPLFCPDIERAPQDIFEYEFSPDGRTVYSEIREASNTWQWLEWDIATGPSRTNVHRFAKSEKTHPIRSFASSRRFAVSQDERGSIFDETSVHVVQSASSNQVELEEALRDLKFSPDGKRAIALTPQRSLALWKIDEGWQHFEFGDTNTHRIYVDDLSDDGETILTKGDGFFEVWKAQTKKRILVLGTENAKMSSDGAWLADVDSSTVKLYSIQSTAILVDTLQNRSEAKELVFSHDSRYLLTRDHFGVLRLWSVPHGDFISVLQVEVRGQRHRRNVHFSPDSDGVLTGGVDQEIQFWRLPKFERPVSEWLALARFFGNGRGETMEGAGDSPVPPQPSFHTQWLALRAKHPEVFTVSSDEIDAWHRHEAWRCESAKDWSNAVVHLSALLETHPGSGDFLPRRAAAHVAWASELVAAEVTRLTNSASSTHPFHPANENDRSLLTSAATNHWESALADYNRTLAWVDRFPAIAKESRLPFVEKRRSVYMKLGRKAEAEADERELKAASNK